MDVEQIIREHIGATVHLSLATSSENKPWVCEVHFAYERELNLYFRSKSERRHSQEIAHNPVVAGNIVAQHELGEQVVGIYFEGIAELSTDINETSPAYMALHERLGVEIDSLLESKEQGGHQFYKITVDNWYAFGRFGADHGQKLSLKWKNA